MFFQQTKDQLDNILLTDSLMQDFKVRVRWVLGSDQAIRDGRGGAACDSRAGSDALAFKKRSEKTLTQHIASSQGL